MKKSISKSLKLYHRRKKMKQDVKAVIGFILFFSLLVQFVMTLAPEYTTPSIVRADEYKVEKKTITDIKEIDKSNFTYKKHVSHRYLTKDEIEIVMKMVKDAGLNVDEAMCLIKNESSFDAEGKLVNRGDVLSVDRGLWAINDYWHAEVSNACAYDMWCSTREAIRIRKANGNWNQWVGYVNNCI